MKLLCKIIPEKKYNLKKKINKQIKKSENGNIMTRKNEYVSTYQEMQSYRGQIR